MNPLPKWALANPIPAIHDFESLTVIDQTARIYGAMNTLINEYNKFAETVNTQLSSFTEEEHEARTTFEKEITELMRQFRCDMEQYLVVNLDDTAVKYLNSAINEGRINLAYDPDSESLDLIITEVNEDE